MADYFTNFSLVVSLPSEAAQTYALELHHRASQASQGDDLPKDFPKELEGALEDWQFDLEADSPVGNHGLWLHSMNGGVDAVCAFIQHLLQRFDPQGRATFEWSHDCSKPRTDAYGGGAAIVTAQEIKTINTAQWLAENAG
ncbi:hypothetical protein NXS98_06180 [Fontisphaera persica]|uniref:hypothetical protein n=1 Tax=Fontisphaera persica TaxID=2974023 RepID=UPI0024C06299|nr:hypothetical protein [Fontisphaera persica]WCJ60712.1 hypothetical protein NXS98_06180 [Fontisphaera persica]